MSDDKCIELDVHQSSMDVAWKYRGTESKSAWPDKGIPMTMPGQRVIIKGLNLSPQN